MKIINFFKSNNSIATEIEYKGIAKYMPLIVCGGFYLSTILLFFFGPFDWKINNGGKMAIFLLLALFALIIGYFIGTLIKREKKPLNLNINHIMLVSFVIYIIIYILNCYATTGKLYPDIIRGLFDSGKAYRISHNISTTIGTYMIYIGIVVAPFTSLIIPIFFIYYKSLNKLSKVFGYITIILSFAIGISQGVISTYAVLAFQIVMFLFVYLFSNIKNKSIIKIFTIIFAIIAILLSFFVYYKVVMSNRLIADASGGKR